MLSCEEQADGYDQGDQAGQDQRGFREELRVHGDGQDSRLHGCLQSFVNRRDSLPGAGIEPAWGFPQEILSLLRLPFRHPGFLRHPSRFCAHGQRGLPSAAGARVATAASTASRTPRTSCSSSISPTSSSMMSSRVMIPSTFPGTPTMAICRRIFRNSLRCSALERSGGAHVGGYIASAIWIRPLVV